MLALFSNDVTVTVSNVHGVTISHTRVKECGLSTQFFARKTGDEVGDDVNLNENLLTANLGGKAILIYDLDGVEEPLELRFQPQYGSIKTYEIIGGAYMVISFDNGYVVVISMDLDMIGEELFSWHLFLKKDEMVDCCVCPCNYNVTAIGTKSLKIIEHSSHAWLVRREKAIRFDRVHTGRLSNLAWSPDGQILTVSTTTGRVYGFCNNAFFLRRWRRQWLRTIWKGDPESADAAQQSLFDFFRRYPGLRQLVGGIITLYAPAPHINGIARLT